MAQSKLAAAQPAGRIQRAPENFLDAAQIAEVAAGRRDFLRKALLTAGSGIAVAMNASPARAEPAGDPNILELPQHSRALGQPVAARGYGQPSQWAKNLQRRESPGLTQVSAASVSFTPFQCPFRVITPNGLHFERHHAGWWDIDPSKHRFMINGLVKNPKVFTLADLNGLPSGARLPFIQS